MSLVGPAELAARLDEPDLRIADVRWVLGDPEKGRRDYEAGHISGAIYVDLDRDLAAPTGAGRHPLPDPAVFAARLGELGFGSDDFIVACDDALGTIAARLWWMLDNLGHARVAILDGGLKAWRAAGLPLSSEVPAVVPRTMRLASAWSNVVDREALIPMLPGITLIDARAAERYRGETEPVDPRAGHIPSAVNAPTRTTLDADGRLLAPDALADVFGAVAPGEAPVVVSCGSGVNACHTAFAMRMAGRPDPILYPGSFSDWSRTELPIATGPEPGSPPTEPPISTKFESSGT